MGKLFGSSRYLALALSLVLAMALVSCAQAGPAETPGLVETPGALTPGAGDLLTPTVGVTGTLPITGTPAVGEVLTPTLGVTATAEVTGTLAITGTPAIGAAGQPSVVVEDQPLENNTVTVARVVSEGPGWMVIHTQVNNAVGPDIGHAPVVAGVNENVVVELDPGQTPTDNLYAMLHIDAGTAGTYDWPNGADVPVTLNNEIVMEPFALTGQ